MTVSAINLFSVFLDSSGALPLGHLLSDNERARAEAFHFEHDRRRWKASRIALRILLSRHISIAPGDISFATTPNGKPFLEGTDGTIEFNLSHSGDRALIAISSAGPVGVDIESLERAKELESCMAIYCSTSEHDRLSLIRDSRARVLELIKIWCAKEAFLKAIGTGFSISPNALATHWDSDGTGRIYSRALLPSQPDLQLYFPGSLDAFGYFAAIALPGQQPCPEILPLEFDQT